MRRRPARWILLGTAVLLAMMANIAPCRAELLYFKAGGRIQAPATVRDGLVHIDTGFGPAVFRESDFLRIVPGYNPEAEWPSRRAVAMKGDTPARLSAAWWALENGLIDQCTAMIEAARKADPVDPLTARLATLLERLQRPLPPPDTTDLRTALGTSFEEASRTHLLLLHQHPDAVARARLDALERIVSAYYLMFAFHDLDLTLPESQLVTVYLRDRETYVRFLESQHAGAFRTTQGYFHPTFRAVLAYEVHLPARGVLTLTAGVSQRAPVHESRFHPDGPGDDEARRRLLKTAEESAYDLGTASHELVHLLVRVSGLDGEPRRLPCWLHEGLAAQFEVYRGGRWAGIGRAHDLRLPTWRAVVTPSSLSQLVSDVGFGHGYRKDLYAESWSLVQFLRRTRPREFMTFIDLLRNPESMEVTSEGGRYLGLFQCAFGDDLDRLERDWAASKADLQTPLERHAPDHQ